MTETLNKVEKWAYPFKVGGAEVTDSQQYYEALSKAKDGFYPIGKNGLWHGGVHFDEGTGLITELAEVRCIADGEIIAYRIDESFPVSNYSETPAAPFSTGFVLVKHTLVPPTSTSAASPPSGGSSIAAPVLSFYSLYMHLLDWKGYCDEPSLKRPSYWGGKVFTVKANAPDSLLGLRVRSDKTSRSSELAVLPRGTIVTTKEAPASQNWLEILDVSPSITGLAQNTGWVFKKEMRHLSGDTYLIDTEAKDPVPEHGRGANIRDLDSGRITGFLPVGTQVKVIDGPGQYKKLVEILVGDAIPMLASNFNSGGLGKVFFASLEEVAEPLKPMGEVYILPNPIKIKAGENIGHVGKYQNNGGASSENVLHLEVFSADDVPKFIEDCKIVARNLPEDQKKIMLVHKGASQVVNHTDYISPDHPPTASAASPIVGFDTVIPIETLAKMPPERKIKVGGGPAGLESFWWRIDKKFADETGVAINGWLHEQTLITTRHSSWEWVGFQYLTETASNLDSLAGHLGAQGALTQDELSSYRAQMDAVDNGPTREWLYNIIDTNNDKRLSVDEIQVALTKYWLAQPISQLISNYESEWLWNEDKWTKLNHLMEVAPGTVDPDWTVEKKRIEKLSWWRVLADGGALNSDGRVWHFHPVGLLGNFYISRIRRDYELGSLSSHYETGGRGSRTVSGGSGDAGGVSYGSYQMTSQTKLENGTVIIGGTVKRFVNWVDMPWGNQFNGLTPGSMAFTEKWKELVDTKGQAFVDVEHEYIKVTHFDIQIQKIILNTGVDLRYHSHTMNDVVWSTAVQQGPDASIIVNAIKAIEISNEETKAYDERLIDAIYAERGRKIMTGEKAGQLHYFSKNSIAVQNGVAERFVSEKAKAQERLKNESGY